MNTLESLIIFSVFSYMNYMKNKIYHTVGTNQKPNIKIVERGKIDTYKYINKWSLTFLTWYITSLVYYRHFNKLVSWVQTFTLSELIRLCKSFSPISKIPTIAHKEGWFLWTRTFEFWNCQIQSTNGEKNYLTTMCLLSIVLIKDKRKNVFEKYELLIYLQICFPV
jgi:hypothetical protein